LFYFLSGPQPSIDDRENLAAAVAASFFKWQTGQFGLRFLIVTKYFNVWNNVRGMSTINASIIN